MSYKRISNDETHEIARKIVKKRNKDRKKSGNKEGQNGLSNRVMIRINDEDYQKLKGAAAVRRTTMAYVLRDLIYKHLPN